MTIDTQKAKDQAKAQIASIVEMVERLEEAEKGTNEEAIEEAHRKIEEDPLSVDVRGGWHTPGQRGQDEEAIDYRILLCTGGPVCRIVGELGKWNEPETAVVQYQDWFTPWIEYTETTEEEDEATLRYAQCFRFGE